MTLPSRIVLSRKGFDSKAGGFPSPIIRGEPFSLPIPDPNDRDNGRKFADIPLPKRLADSTGANSMESLVMRLGYRIEKEGRAVHLDPDIRPELRPKHDPPQRNIFGQDSSALGELRKHGVGEGALFLFFGLFQELDLKGLSSRLRFAGKPRHIIWGWLWADDEICIKAGTALPAWASEHPHVVNRDKIRKNNVLYVAGEGKARSGTFATATPFRRLSVECTSCRSDCWSLPDDIAQCAMNRQGKAHNPALRNKNSVPLHCQSPHEQRSGFSMRDMRGQGQEYIFDTTKNPAAFDRWLSAVFS